jgi:hypothetical protein
MITERCNYFFRTDKEKAKEADKIMSLLKDSPALNEARRDRDKKRLSRVRALLAERDRIQRDHGATLQRLESAVIESQEKEKRAHEALQAATRNRVNAEAAKSNASLDLSFNRSKLEGEVRSLAPAEIGDFILEMLAVDEKARLELKVEQRSGPKGWLTGEVKHTIVNSNSEAVDKKTGGYQIGDRRGGGNEAPADVP